MKRARLVLIACALAALAPVAHARPAARSKPAAKPARATPKNAPVIDPATFDHNRAPLGFPLDGQHAQLPCESCHRKPGVYTGAMLTCEGCHQPPKHGEFGACKKCHNTTSFIATSFSHDKTAFPLDGKHIFNINATCEACHASLHPGDWQKSGRDCALCHADPHAGGWKPSKCSVCHGSTTWSPTTIDSSKHAALFGSPLRGKHAGVACTSCHTDRKQTPPPKQHASLPRTCVGCHTNTHGTMFSGQPCESCHTEASWHHVPGFDHLQATVGCATCHKAKHGDVYSKGAVGGNCNSCHVDTKRWDKTNPFDHQQTMFPLDRRHRAAACSSCHDPKKPAAQAACSTCHDDPHRGRAQRECEDCHRGDRWTLVRWDHDRSLFPLRGRHFGTPCRDCHTNDEFTGLRPECIACHRGDMARANAEHMDHRTYSFDCVQCHSPFKW